MKPDESSSTMGLLCWFVLVVASKLPRPWWWLNILAFARPPVEACGIDVDAIVDKNGFPLHALSKDEEMNCYGRAVIGFGFFVLFSRQKVPDGANIR